MRENENLPAVERLSPQEFNLDVEEQRRVEATVQEEVNRVKLFFFFFFINKDVSLHLMSVVTYRR